MLPKNGTKRKSPESFESTNNSELSHATGGAWTRTLSPERDFKSLVSASLRQSHFLFVVSFDSSLRERFFICEREGFSFFDEIILPSFSLHVNHVKLFHLVVLDLRSVRGPELPPRGVCSAQMRSSGWVIVWWGYWWSHLNDGLSLIFEKYFWSSWCDFEPQMTLMTSYLYRSVLFNCSIPDLSCCPFAEISPEVILRLGVINGCILFDMKQLFH